MSESAQLCLACGMCCDGTLFKDVELQSGDDARRLKALDLPVVLPRSSARVARFVQPCAALCADRRCRVYANRPLHCRQFACALLQNFEAGSLDSKTALKTIHQTRRRVNQVLRLLRELGDRDEHLPLTRRFQRMKRRMEAGKIPDTRDLMLLPDAEAAFDRYADLTLAMHELQSVLRLAFYPVPGEPG